MLYFAGFSLLLLTLSVLLFFRNKTSLAAGFFFDAFFLCAALLLFIFVAVKANTVYWLYIPGILTLPFVFLLIFSLYILIAALLMNIKYLFKYKERGLLHNLALLLALLLMIYLAVSILRTDVSPPLFAQILWVAVLFIVLFYWIHILAFLTTTFTATLIKPRKATDYIIVLDSSLSAGKTAPLSSNHIDAAIHRAYKQRAKTGTLPVLVFCNGQTHTEDEAIHSYAAKKGYPPQHILIENRAQNTYEKMAFAKELIEKHCSDKPSSCVYITHSYHLLCAGIYAKKAGLRANGIGIKTARRSLPNALLHEYIAYLKLYKKQLLACAIFIGGLFAYLFSLLLR